ncbi:MAG TPA: DUF885 family protein [Chitinophagaceae bacterium]|nr:DUF885 family protein [Chitinophagaceae bacterium]
MVVLITMNFTAMRTLLLTFFSLVLFCCCTQAQINKNYVPCNDMPNMMQNYDADITALNRVYIVDGSPEKRERYKKVAVEYLGRLKQLDFNSLPQECKADYILFKRDLNESVHDAEVEEKEFNALKQWFPFADSIYALEKIRRRGGAVNSKEVAYNFNNITKQLKTLDSKLSGDKTITVNDSRRALQIIGGLQDAAKNVFTFYNSYDPLFTWWVPMTYHAMDSSLSVYAKTFRAAADVNSPNKDSSGIVGYPIGRDEIVRQLKYEMIDYTPEELIDIANKEFAWCDKEMLKASNEMGYGNDWKKALEKVKESYVPVGEQPQAMVKLYDESIDFLKKKDLITIPPLAEETWRIVMMSPKQQLVNPFFYGGEEFSVSYPTNTMDFDARMMSMRGNNPHFSRATVHHELIAGHYLQQFMNDRVYTYRHYETPFWTEGWSLYWEFVLWNEGFPQSPEDRIGMLFWRMHRCARIIFSLNYHMGKWTPQQCIDFLVDRVGHERANAEGEVRRSFVGGYSPLYQVAYMIGGLELMALQHELVGKGKMTLKQYHDAVMHENSMPIEMLRNILGNHPLTADYQTQWRFYDLP